MDGYMADKNKWEARQDQLITCKQHWGLHRISNHRINEHLYIFLAEHGAHSLAQTVNMHFLCFILKMSKLGILHFDKLNI